MSNHQEAGIEDFLGLMTQSHPVRFSEKFWQVFTERVEPKLPANPQIVDLGSGPGLFLQELSERLPAGKLRGYDVNDEMLKYARALPIPAGRAKFSAVDLASEMPQLPPAQTDLVTMNFSFHIFDYPVPILKWIKSGLKPRTGIFMHYG
ncbi:MAG TPA: hypothetical protein DHU55_08085, partial [Blastocatellia bacterium]|nr:hypothetical protein [Blastocatellia bacterium]